MRSNEKFSGSGHRDHVCRECASSRRRERKIAIGMEQIRAGQVVEGEQAVEEVLENLRRRCPRAEGT
jgi:hypothetical protein